MDAVYSGWVFTTDTVLDVVLQLTSLGSLGVQTL